MYGEEFRGKVCIVTGASSGIGRALALALAEYGCKLTLTGRNEERLEETRKQCQAAGADTNDILLVSVDLSVEKGISGIVERTIEKFQHLHFLVNNAGILHLDVQDDSMEKYHYVQQVNLHSIVYLNKLALPYLEMTKGSIVNISSICGSRPVTGCLGYALSKAALDHYTRIMGITLAEKGIRINSVNPGIVDTGIFRAAGIPDHLVSAVLQKGTTMNELNRNGETEEVARVVCFLLSEKSSQTTGTIVPIDGGFSNMVLNSGENPDVLAAMAEI